MNSLTTRIGKRLAVAFGLLLGASSALGQQVIFVNARAVGGNDGTSWEDAYTDLQSGLWEAAETQGPGKVSIELWVATATYRPAGPAGDRTATFQLLTDMGLYAGFAGGETELDQRDPDVNVTILSGDLNGDDGEDFANNRENSYHVVTGSNTDATAMMDGFTVRGGKAEGGSPDWHGGALFIVDGSPSLRNCIFEGNDSVVYSAAIVNIGTGHPVLEACVLTGNRGQGFWNTFGASSGATFTNCVFENHDRNGVEASDGTLTFTNCQFLNNGNPNGLFGGGLYLDSSDASAILTGCTFENNAADEQGGGIANAGTLTLINCLFSGNTAYEGGAILSASCALTLTNCTLTDNTATLGGGIWNGCAVNIDNSILWGNTALAGTLEEQQIWTYSLADLPTVNHSIVEGWTGQWGGEGNSGDDPEFLEGTQQPMRGSPAIDTGNNDAVPSGIDTDIVGNPRFVDGNGDQNAIVDLGAYELQPLCEGDANGDATVDPLDAGFVLARFGCPVGTGDPNCDAADQNGNGIVDPLDVGFVLARFGECP